MEAKVDIRKLQLLNDRINQTIDALNQVRLSVHGLSHTAGMQGQVPSFGPGLGMTGMGGFGGMGVPGFQGGFSPQAFGQYGQPPVYGNWGGMSHTGNVGLGVGQNPLAAQNPFLAQMLGMNPYLQQGISHTSPEAQWLYQQQTQIDPYYGMRVSQTFPFAQLPLSPLG